MQEQSSLSTYDYEAHHNKHEHMILLRRVCVFLYILNNLIFTSKLWVSIGVF